MEPKYRISFQSGNIRFEIESTDKTWVENKEKEYLEEYIHKRKIEPLLEKIEDESSKEMKFVPISPSISINEFYRKHVKENNITSRPDITTFMVYYLQKILKKDEITTNDIVRCYADISYPNYNKINMPDVLNRAKRKAFLNFVNNFWKLTLTGEDFVLNIISGKSNA